MKQAFCGLIILFSSLRISAQTAAPQAPESTGWEKAAEILARIKAPAFPARDFAIADYGAVAGVDHDCTSAIRRAVEACSVAGGGRVVIPAGVYRTGAIRLTSNVNLHLDKGATLQFTTDPAGYLPAVFCRWEGIECMNYSPLIYAFEQENIAVTGEGTLDGGASDSSWWAWTHRSAGGTTAATADVKALNAMSENGVPVQQRVFGGGHFLRPNFIEPYRSRNVLIEGVTILRSPMWEINPVLCTNVIVHGVSIATHGPNNDGCDPESCRDVLIEECVFNTGDDCIAIKSGRNDDGRRVGVPSENVIVRGCTMKDGHAGVAIGSEIAGGCRNVFIENCRMDSPILDRALRIKSNARRGGTVENVYMRNVHIGQVAEALLTVDLLYEEGPNGAFPPVVRNIVIDSVTSRASPRLFFINGFKGATIDNIRVANSTFLGVSSSEVLQHVGRIVLENVTMEGAGKVRSRSSRQLSP